jgi:hypothetical protein
MQEKRKFLVNFIFLFDFFKNIIDVFVALLGKIREIE